MARQLVQGQRVFRRPARRIAAGLDRGLHAPHRRPVGKPQERLRRLRRQVRGDGLLGPLAVRACRRRHGLQGEVFATRVRRSTSMVRSPCPTRPRFRHSGALRDPNRHNFRYINNINPENEQENVNLSLKGDWDVAATLTSYVAWNDQTNYFLDGRRERRVLPVRVRRHPPRDQRREPDGPGLRTAVLRRALRPLVHAGRRRRGRLSAAVRPSTCGGYPVPAARPGRPQPRGAPDLAGRPATALGRRRVFRGHRPARRRLAGLGPAARLPHDRIVPASGPNPTDLLYDDDFASKVYAVFGQVAYDVVDNFEIALALRYDSEDREVSNNVDLRRRRRPLRADRRISGAAGASWCRCPTTSIPALPDQPGARDVGIPDRSETFEQLQPKVR